MTSSSSIVCICPKMLSMMSDALHCPVTSKIRLHVEKFETCGFAYRLGGHREILSRSITWNTAENREIPEREKRSKSSGLTSIFSQSKVVTRCRLRYSVLERPAIPTCVSNPCEQNIEARDWVSWDKGIVLTMKLVIPSSRLKRCR